MSECVIEECPSPVIAKDMCSMHWQRVQRHGHPTVATKACPDCGSTFQYEISKGRRKPFCDPCTRERQKVHNSTFLRRRIKARAGEDPELLQRLRSYEFRGRIAKYGISIAQYEELLAKQDGRCAICGSPPDANGRGAYSRLHIDHSHSTGKIRGLLCGRCNQGIGFMRDDPKLLRLAAAYLD